MELGLSVEDPDSLHERLRHALERSDEPNPRSPPAFFAPTFMREHTRYESFDAFCAASPWDAEDVGRLDRVDTGELDAFVAATTEFDDWAEMERTAAIEDVLVRTVAR